MPDSRTVEDHSVPNSKGNSGMKTIPGMELEDRGNEGEVKTSPSNLTEKEVTVHIWMFL
jgi:hypothetical protein